MAPATVAAVLAALDIIEQEPERREQLWGKEALDNPDLLMPPASVAASYWQLYQQPRSAWTFEMEIRPFGEKW